MPGLNLVMFHALVCLTLSILVFNFCIYGDNVTVCLCFQGVTLSYAHTRLSGKSSRLHFNRFPCKTTSVFELQTNRLAFNSLFYSVLKPVILLNTVLWSRSQTWPMSERETPAVCLWHDARPAHAAWPYGITEMSYIIQIYSVLTSGNIRPYAASPQRFTAHKRTLIQSPELLSAWNDISKPFMFGFFIVRWHLMVFLPSLCIVHIVVSVCVLGHFLLTVVASSCFLT